MTTIPPSNLSTGPTLVLDCSTTRTQLGLLEHGDWLAFMETEGEALESIFCGLSELLRQSQRQLRDLSGVAIGIGPGSILGLRLALMALQTWRKLPELQHWLCYEFYGLHLQAQLLATQGHQDFHLISDFRGSSWHLLTVAHGSAEDLQIAGSSTIEKLVGKIYYSPTGRGRQAMPEIDHEAALFSLASLPEIAPRDWARQTAQPQLYLPSPPVFKKWDAQPHRGNS